MFTSYPLLGALCPMSPHPCWWRPPLSGMFLPVQPPPHPLEVLETIVSFHTIPVVDLPATQPAPTPVLPQLSVDQDLPSWRNQYPSGCLWTGTGSIQAPPPPPPRASSHNWALPPTPAPQCTATTQPAPLCSTSSLGLGPFWVLESYQGSKCLIRKGCRTNESEWQLPGPIKLHHCMPTCQHVPNMPLECAS